MSNIITNFEEPSNIPLEDGYTIKRWAAFGFKFTANREVLDYAYDVVVDEIPCCSVPTCKNQAILECRFFINDDSMTVGRTCSDFRHLSVMEEHMKNMSSHIVLNFRSNAYMDNEHSQGRYLAEGNKDISQNQSR